MLLAEKTRIDGFERGLSGIERRRGLRIRQMRPIKIFEPMVSRYFGGQTEDISTTGLKIELSAGTLIRPGKFLNIHVGSNGVGESLANRRQMMPARVVWVDRSQSESTGKCMAGVEFLASVAARRDAA